MDIKKLFILTFVVLTSSAEKLSIESYSDIFTNLKENGMLEKFEDHLKEMLIEESEKKQTQLLEDFDTLEFIKAYAEQKKIVMNEKVMLYLMDLNPESSLNKHLAQLTIVLDKIGHIFELKSRELEIKLINLLRRTKSLPVLKNNVDKLFDEEASHLLKENQIRVPEQVRPKEVKVEAKTNRKTDSKASEVTATVTKFLEDLKSNPEPLLEALITSLSSTKILSPATLKVIVTYARMIADTEYFVTFVDIVINYVEDVAETEFGERFSKMVPHLMKAKTTKEILEIIYVETDLNLYNLLAMLQNSDVRNKLMDTFAALITSIVRMAESLLMDDMKISFANTFLMSMGFPAIHQKKLINSSLKLAERVVGVMSGWDVNLLQYEVSIVDNIKRFEEDYMTWEEYRKLNEREQSRLMAQFFGDNLAEPIQLIWLANNNVLTNADGPRCAETMLCNLNSYIKSSGQTVKSAITQGLSILASWAWSLDGKMDSWKLYEAVWRGKNSENCDLHYLQAEVRACHVFPWQSKLMSLDFEHTEL